MAEDILQLLTSGLTQNDGSPEQAKALADITSAVSAAPNLLSMIYSSMLARVTDCGPNLKRWIVKDLIENSLSSSSLSSDLRATRPCVILLQGVPELTKESNVSRSAIPGCSGVFGSRSRFAQQKDGHSVFRFYISPVISKYVGKLDPISPLCLSSIWQLRKCKSRNSYLGSPIGAQGIHCSSLGDWTHWCAGGSNKGRSKDYPNPDSWCSCRPKGTLTILHLYFDTR